MDKTLPHCQRSSVGPGKTMALGMTVSCWVRNIDTLFRIASGEWLAHREDFLSSLEYYYEHGYWVIWFWGRIWCCRVRMNMHKGFHIPWAITWQEKIGIPLAAACLRQVETLPQAGKTSLKFDSDFLWILGKNLCC